jgi:uncharacterized protein (TIGR03545 family)
MKFPKVKFPKLRFPAIFRWKYVLPRLLILGAVYGAVRWGLDPLLKYAIVAGGEAALGAKVEVTELSTSILDGEITLDGLAAANPHKPLRNLAEAEHMRLEVDFAALVRKRFVVRNGRVRGVKFDSERTTSGALELSPGDADAGPSMFDPAIAAAGDAAVQWFDGLQGRLTEDLESKLATPRVLGELENRWQQQYAALKKRADDLQAKAKRIEADFREAKKNPLRSVAVLAALKDELAATQTELKTTLAEIQALPAQAKADRAAIDAARKQDQQFLKDSLNVVKTDGGQLTEYLLGETAHGYIADSVAWVHYLRSWIPQSKMARPARARGTNVHFVDCVRPKCLIERVTLTGAARLGGQPVELTGLLTDATTEPELHERPLQLHVSAGGAMTADLLVTIDRRDGAARDTLILDCPHLAIGERTLGKADSLAVTVAPGDAAIKADLALEGDQLTGLDARRQNAQAARRPHRRDARRLAARSGPPRGDIQPLRHAPQTEVANRLERGSATGRWHERRREEISHRTPRPLGRQGAGPGRRATRQA